MPGVCAKHVRDFSEAVRAIKRLLRAGITLPPVSVADHGQAEFPAPWASDRDQKAAESWLQRRSGDRGE